MKLNQKSQSKVIVAMAGVILLLVALCASFTFAYFTSSDTSTDNQTLTFDTLTVTVNDTDGEGKLIPWAVADGEQETLTTLLPGCKVDMAGTVSLAGADAYVRITFEAEVAGVSDTELTTALATEFAEMFAAQEANGSSWIDVGNGVWVCIAASSEGTIIDFSKGQLEISATEIGNDYQGKTLSIGYSVDAIQAAHVTVSGADDEEKAAALNTLITSAVAGDGVVA